MRIVISVPTEIIFYGIYRKADTSPPALRVPQERLN